MKKYSQDEFKAKYGAEALNSFASQPLLPKFFNTKRAGDVFQRVAEDINTAKQADKNIPIENRVQGAGLTAPTTLLQGGLAPFRAAFEGFAGTQTGTDVTEGVANAAGRFGDAITPQVLQEAIGKYAMEAIEGYESMSPEEQLRQRNKLSVAEVLSYYTGGSAAKDAIVAPTVRGVEGVAESATKAFGQGGSKSVDDVVKETAQLKDKVQAIVGKHSVEDQFESSASRLVESEPPFFLKGTAGRVENVVEKYDRFYENATKETGDIMEDAPLSEVGQEVGAAFRKVVKNRQEIGAQLGEELKNNRNIRVSIVEAVENVLAELKDSGLSYNPRTRQLVTFQGTKLAPDEILMLNTFINRMKLLGEAPTVRDIDNFISRVRSDTKITKSKNGIIGKTNSDRIMDGALAALRGSLNPEKNGIQQLNKYWELNQAYSDLSNFVEEGVGFLGKVTQSGDFAKDASLAKSAVQSLLNNGKKDWLIRLEGLSGYKALDNAVLALQAMKDAGNYKGLTLLQTIKEGGIPTNKASAVGKIIDFGTDLGKRVVLGKPNQQTRAFLKELAGAKQDLKTPSKRVVAPKDVPKTKEIAKIEKDIEKNVKAQKAAIKANDFDLVAKLKAAYKKLVNMLKAEVRKIRDLAKETGSNRGFVKNPFVRDEISAYKKSDPKGRNLLSESRQALKDNPRGNTAARELLRSYKGGDNKLSRTEVATAIDILNGTAVKKGFNGTQDLPKDSRGNQIGLSTQDRGAFGKGAEEVFNDYGTLTAKHLKHLEGKGKVNKQFIADLSNKPELKQPERDLIRAVLAEFPDGKISAKEYAERIKTRLLPLESNSARTRYENITLPDDLRGNIADYDEVIYESPISNSAGDVHYGGVGFNNYFAHTRIEDMADGKIRRVIEAQSDLMQRGRLEAEIKQLRDATELLRQSDAKKYAEIIAENEQQIKGFESLMAYRNTWWERIIREEVRQAALDGKKKLQFPTGETAVKIEGLHRTGISDDVRAGDLVEFQGDDWMIVSNNWDTAEAVPLSQTRSFTYDDFISDEAERWTDVDALYDELNWSGIRSEIADSQELMDAHELVMGRAADPDGGEAIIKKELEEKFDIADLADTLARKRYPTREAAIEQLEDMMGGDGKHFEVRNSNDFEIVEYDINYSEQIPLGDGDLDTSNPIYKFYEKDVQKYLNKNYKAKVVTDEQGVQWVEFDVPGDAKKLPIEAFGVAGAVGAGAFLAED